jgi:predicted MFS family arabinose efflux permease
MDVAARREPAPAPGELPDARAILALLTALNFLNYVDRYVLNGVLEKIKHDPAFAGISDARLGLLTTSFLVVYMLASPLAGALGFRVARKYLVAVGVGLWSVATVASGVARNYHELLLARALIGFGEAGYATVAPAMISDLFSPSRRARVLALFYLATPVGSALGLSVSGILADAWGWRGAFFIAGGPGLLLACAVPFMREPPRGAQEGGARSGRSFVEEARALAGNRLFLRIAIGTTLWVFAVGGLAAWMPTYFQRARHLSATRAGLYFGVPAVVAGIVATFAGGVLGDAWTRRTPRGHLLLSGLGLVVAAPLAAAAPFAPTIGACIAFGFGAQLGVFLNTGPLNTALVNSVEPPVREFAIGVQVLCIHLLGDAISPPLIGRFTTFLEEHGRSPERALSLAVAATALPMLLGGLVLLGGGGRARGQNGATGRSSP